MSDETGGTDRDPMAALETAIEHVEAVDDDDRVARVQAEQDAAHELTGALADAVSEGMNETRVGHVLGAFADETAITKTELRGLFDNSKQDDEPDRKPLHRFIEDGLHEVQIVRSTDHYQAAHYKWDFGEFVVQTGAGTGERHHMRADRFAKEILGASDVLPDTSPYEGRDSLDWRPIAATFIDEFGAEVEHVGPRTTAVNQLQDYVRQSIGYADAETAAERNGIYLPGEARPDGGSQGEQDSEDGDGPDDGEDGERAWREREIWVPAEVAMSICEDYELGNSTVLQSELDARGHTVDRRRGASYTTFVGGMRQTFWILAPDFADPAEFVTDPEDPATKAERRKEQEQDAADDPDPYSPNEAATVADPAERARNTALYDGGEGGTEDGDGNEYEQAGGERE